MATTSKFSDVAKLYLILTNKEERASKDTSRMISSVENVRDAVDSTRHTIDDTNDGVKGLQESLDAIRGLLETSNQLQSGLLQNFVYFKQQSTGKLEVDGERFRNVKTGKFASKAEFEAQEFGKARQLMSDEDTSTTATPMPIKKLLGKKTPKDPKSPIERIASDVEQIRKVVTEVYDIDKAKSKVEEMKADTEREQTYEAKAAKAEAKKADKKEKFEHGGRTLTHVAKGETSWQEWGLEKVLGSGITSLITAIFGKEAIMAAVSSAVKTLSIGALIVSSLVMLVEDFFDGLDLADAIGTSKTAGVIGTIFGGAAEGGLLNAFKTAGKLALYGATIGSVVPVVGTLAGGLIGAALGAIGGFIGGGAIAKAADTVIDTLTSWWDKSVVTVLDFTDFLMDVPDKMKVMFNSFVSGIVSSVFGFVGDMMKSVADIEIGIPKDGILGTIADTVGLPDSIKPFSFLKGAAESTKSAGTSVKKTLSESNRIIEQDIADRKEAREIRHAELNVKEAERAKKSEGKETTNAAPVSEKKTETIQRIGGEDWTPGTPLKKIQMQAIAWGQTQGVNYSPEVMTQYNKQKQESTSTSEKSTGTTTTTTPVTAPTQVESKTKEITSTSVNGAQAVAFNNKSPEQLSDEELAQAIDMSISGVERAEEEYKRKKSGWAQDKLKSKEAQLKMFTDEQSKRMKAAGFTDKTAPEVVPPSPKADGKAIDEMSKETARGKEAAGAPAAGGNIINTNNVIKNSKPTTVVMPSVPTRSTEMSFQRAAGVGVAY